MMHRCREILCNQRKIPGIIPEAIWPMLKFMQKNGKIHNVGKDQNHLHQTTNINYANTKNWGSKKSLNPMNKLARGENKTTCRGRIVWPSWSTLHINSAYWKSSLVKNLKYSKILYGEQVSTRVGLGKWISGQYSFRGCKVQEI